MAETKDGAREAAEKIMAWSRKKLAMALPPFLPVIYLLREEACQEAGPLWTDGAVVYYHPSTVVKDYLQYKDSIAEQLMHIITHGLLGHFPKRHGQLESLFDAAADIKVAAFLEEVNGFRMRKKEWTKETTQMMKQQSGASLESLYLTPASSPEAQVMLGAAQPLRKDSHAAWCRRQDGGQGGGDGVAFLEGLWSAVASQVSGNLVQQGYGHLAAAMSEMYREVQESSVSYTEFLKQFCAVQERCQIDPDSIDRLWYHVGLELNGDIPLVEPLEVREDAPALELAVALDTSGSCCGDVMRGFLGELLAILRDVGGPRVELTLIQCDAEIQSIQTLTREDSEEQIMKQFQVLGCGGTDFRPVFEYVEQQREEPDGKKFRGLLYLSDGYGDFPEKAPDYPVVFMLPRESDEDDFFGRYDPLPKWVQEVYITADNRLVVKEK